MLKTAPRETRNTPALSNFLLSLEFTGDQNAGTFATLAISSEIIVTLFIKKNVLFRVS